MSYILDALRKSDLQRSRGAAPTLLSSHIPTAIPRRPPFLPYAFLTLAVLATGIFIGWLRPWQTHPTESKEVLTSGAGSVIERSNIAALPIAPASPMPPLMREAPKKFEHETAAPKPVPALPQSAPPAVSQHEVPNAAMASAAPPTAPPAAATLPPPATPAPTIVAAGAGEAKTLSFAELPVPIQQEIPHFAISVHAYSSQPRNRLVTIDDRLLHEGDSIAPDLKLEQITADGLIMSYKGYRFHRTVREMVNNR